jgi:hypothetical protein
MISNTLAMINAYLDGGSGSTMEQIIMKQAYGDIVRLTAERDEARRDVCDMMHMTGFLAGDFAHSKGWDCFKDGDKHPWSDDVVNFRNIYYAYSDELTAQRDAAWLKIGRIQNEIDCRVQHGAESNGHLEAILAMIKEESK